MISVSLRPRMSAKMPLGISISAHAMGRVDRTKPTFVTAKRKSRDRRPKRDERRAVLQGVSSDAAR